MATTTTPSPHGLYGGIMQGQEQETYTGPSREMSNTTTIPPSTALAPSPASTSSSALPNPPFVFPSRPNPASSPSNSFSGSRGRRTRSALELKGFGPGSSSSQNNDRHTSPALPNFSFNSASQTGTITASTNSPQSPSSPMLVPTLNARAGGHRRGGSEFIGGDGKTGTGELMSTSPTKGDGTLTLPEPPTTSLGPSTGRRGHAHRRSAAISCHDISMILKPTSANINAIGGSAPTSPSENEIKTFSFPASLDGAIHRPTLESNNSSSTVTSVGTPQSPKLGPSNRARVGFSDTLEFIPRPLSLVSSDTSSTMTLRPGHSVSGSLSSVISAGASSPPQRGHVSPVRSFQNNGSRPSTAGEVFTMELDGAEEVANGPQRRNSVPFLSEEAGKLSPAPLTPRGSKKFFFFGEASGEASPTKSRPVSSNSSERARSNLSTPSSPEIAPAEEPLTSRERSTSSSSVSRRNSITRKPSKKQKKVKSWAGSILSRKSRQRSQKKGAHSRRSPTPPLRLYEAPMETQIEYIPEFLSSSLPESTTTPPLPTLDTTYTSWRPRQVAPPDDDSMSPIIDLDAALGPFNTPTALGYDPEWDASQRGGRAAKKRMHSGAVSRQFLRNEIPFHKRSESAPEMDNPRFNLHRLGSSSTMADVFEEDEEDDWEDQTISHKGSRAPIVEEEKSDLGISPDVGTPRDDKSMDWTTDDDASQQRTLVSKNSELSESDRRPAVSSAKSQQSGSSLKDESIKEGSLYSSDNEHTSSLREIPRATSSDSKISPGFRADPPRNLVPVDVHTIVRPPSFLSPGTPQSTLQSPFPSPRSPMSYDAQRLSTAPSSLTEEHTFQSLLLGEPGPEIRRSVDDVPSLTSSNSTMTRDSMAHPGFNNPQFRPAGTRSVSLSSPSMTRKRSSIASLSRLLSSHGEKSKLSIEESAQDLQESTPKSNKGKRLSRMMMFWKPTKDSPA